MNHRFALSLLFALAARSASGTALAQNEVLEQVYGNGVHAYFAGNLGEAQRLFSEAIRLGIQDPRCYYFRGMSYLMSGYDAAARADFARGAHLEYSASAGLYNVGKSLERIQGYQRLVIEQYRSQARLAAASQRERLRQERNSGSGGLRPLLRPPVAEQPEAAEPPVARSEPEPAAAEPQTPPSEAPIESATEQPAEEMPAEKEPVPTDDPFAEPTPVPAKPAAPATPTPAAEEDPFAPGAGEETKPAPEAGKPADDTAAPKADQPPASETKPAAEGDSSDPFAEPTGDQKTEAGSDEKAADTEAKPEDAKKDSSEESKDPFGE